MATKSSNKKKVTGTTERPSKKKPGNGDRPKDGDDPKDGAPPVTTERERHKCACDSSNTYFFTIGSVRNKRIVLTVSSMVTCDPATPQHCQYEYTASAAFQKRQGRRWIADRTRRAFIRKFAVKDPVNSTESPDRADQTELTMTDWFPKAPQKDSIDVELKLVASVRGGWEREIKRKAELCVPKLDNPHCPETP